MTLVLSAFRMSAGVLLLLAAVGTHAGAPATRAVTPEELAVELAGQRGKVVLFNAWATWCVPCRAEIPDLLELAAEMEGEGLVLLGLSIDEPGSLAAVEDFRSRFFPAFRTFLRSGSDLDKAVSVIDPAWNEVVPTTWVIGRDGEVLQRIQGKKSLAEFRAAARAGISADR